ncbi:MAG: response regulator [Opitutaceae bacterium]|nr:response regulator [Verrucomicrobiales bacterium]
MKRILFVDDDAEYLGVITELWKAWSKEQWETFTATKMDEVFSVIRRAPLDLIVIDLKMPVVDGLQLLQLLHRRFPNLQKVIWTGETTDAKRAACLASGAELCVHKPRTREENAMVFSAFTELTRWQPESGFRGVLRQVGLSDVIQIECLSGNSSVLEVSGGNQRGFIFIKNGRIIHALMTRWKGEEALNRILALNGGEFSLKAYNEPSETTIDASWEGLLMEAARVKDEFVEPVVPETAEVPDVGEAQKSRKPAASPERRPDATDVARRLAGVQAISGLESSLLTAQDGRPTRIDEFLICTEQGEVLYEWQCPQTSARISLLEFISKKSQSFDNGLPLGPFERIEIEAPKSRTVIKVMENKGILMRASLVED